MRLKIVENFDTSFTLEPTAKAELFNLLTKENFLQQICQELKVNRVEFTELLFQPVPYSLETPKGMPKEFELYYQSSDYAIINVPPKFVFQAKIFQPSRLCAIYRKIYL
jgi:hypothetical protein